MISRFLGKAATAALRWALVLQVIGVAAGVSMPATAADDPAWRSERGERGKRDRQGEGRERRRARDHDGERGHVSRRGDLVERSTHVEKKEGWRRID